jgi:hypothetical protein
VQQDRVGLLLGEPRRARLQALEVVVPQEARNGEQDVDVGVMQDPAELARLAEGVDRHHHRADSRRRQPRHDPVRAVGHQQSDVRALAHAGGEQAPGELLRPLRGLRVGDPVVVQQDERAVAELRDPGLEEDGEGGGEFGKRHAARRTPADPHLESPDFVARRVRCSKRSGRGPAVSAPGVGLR